MEPLKYLPGDATVAGTPPRNSGSRGLVMGRAVERGSVLLTFVPVQEVAPHHGRRESVVCILSKITQASVLEIDCRTKNTSVHSDICLAPWSQSHQGPYHCSLENGVPFAFGLCQLLLPHCAFQSVKSFLLPLLLRSFGV